MNNEKFAAVILAIALIIGVLVVALSFLGFFTPKLENNASNYNFLVSKENPNDICAVPAGEDPVQWREHLGHHPDKYSQCLK